MIALKRTNSDDADFRALVVLLDAVLRERDGDEHAFYNQFNKVDAIQHVVVAYENGIPVGCGAIKKYSSKITEVKRMFVHDDYRRKGIAQKVLSELEKWAAELEFTSCILETGKKQPEAITLYLKCSYTIIPNYGQYIGVENSVCMEKVL